MKNPIRVLYVDDSPFDRTLVRDALEIEHDGFVLTEAISRSDFETFLAQGEFDLVLSDFNILGFDGLQVLDIVKENNPQTPVVIVTGTGSEEIAVEAMKRGADDYVIKTLSHIRHLPHTLHVVLEKRQLEESLEASYRRFRALIENSNDVIAQFDAEGTVTFVSETITRDFGYLPEDVMGQGLADYIHPDDTPAFGLRWVELLESPDGVTQMEFRLRHKNGSWRWVGIAAQNLFHDPAVQSIIFNFRDITERKRAEEALADQHTLLRTVIDNLPDAIYVKDTAGRKILTNHADLENIGKTEEQALGKTPWDIFPAEIAERLVANDQAVLKNGQAFINREEFLVTANGQERWLLSSKVPLRDSQGRIAGLVGIGHDITERKQAGDTLRQRLAELEALHTVSAALRTAETSQQALSLLLDKTLAALETDSGVILLYDPADDELRPTVTRGWFWETSETPMRPGDGIVGKVFSSGQIHPSPEFRSDPLAHAGTRERIPSGWGGVCLPLRAGPHTIGVLMVAVPIERPLMPEQVNLLESLVEMGGTALHRMRLHEETAHRLAQVQALHAIDTAITSTLDLPQVLDVVLGQTMAQLGVDAASLLLLDPTNQILTYAAGRGFRTRIIEDSRLHIGEGFAGKALLRQQMVHYPDPTEATGFIRASLLAEEGFVDYYGVPMVAKERIVGVLEVFQRTPYTGDEEWLSFLETLAGQAAIAVENATLFAETQRLLEEAQAQAQLTQKIIDSAPEGMLVLDSQQRLMQANPVARRYLPVLAQMNNGDVLTSLDGNPLTDFLGSVGDSQPWHEVSWGQPSRMYEVAAQPLSAGQQAGGWVLVMRDVTEDRERQRYQEAQERLATVGQLAAGIAHDFNNIMGGIVLYTQLMRNDPSFSAKHKQYLTVIYDQSQHAANLIRQILDFSRSAPMQKIALDIAQLVKELVKLLERTLPENITIELAYDRNEYVVNGDPTRLQQMLMNLSFNARDAMPNGGRLSFQLATFPVVAGQAPPLPDMGVGEWVQLTVVDTGEGIEAEHLSHLFEPFFTTKEPGKGTGLGLAQVHGIVKQHDGSIAVESQVGRGTTLTVYLPLHSTVQPPTQPATTDEGLSGDGEMILLVEDNPAMRMAVSDSLEGLGYRVFAAADGVEALEVLTQQSKIISLMLSDLVMPRMGGVELAQAAHRRHPSLKIVIMTGHPLHENEDELRQSGIEGWIRKPFSIDELAKQLQAVLGVQ